MNYNQNPEGIKEGDLVYVAKQPTCCYCKTSSLFGHIFLVKKIKLIPVGKCCTCGMSATDILCADGHIPYMVPLYRLKKINPSTPKTSTEESKCLDSPLTIS